MNLTIFKAKNTKFSLGKNMKISIGYGNYLFDRSSYANINRDTIPSKTVSSNELKCFSPLYFDCLIATILTVTRRSGVFPPMRFKIRFSATL